MTDTSRNDDFRASRYQIALLNQQSRHLVNEARLTAAATAVLQDSEFSSAAISLAVVDDERSMNSTGGIWTTIGRPMC